MTNDKRLYVLPQFTLEFSIVSTTIFAYLYVSNLTLPSLMKKVVFKLLLAAYLPKSSLIPLRERHKNISKRQFISNVISNSPFNCSCDELIPIDMSLWTRQALLPRVSLNLINYLSRFLPLDFSFPHFHTSALQISPGFEAFYLRLHDFCFSTSISCTLYPYKFHPSSRISQILRIPCNILNSYLQASSVLLVHHYLLSSLLDSRTLSHGFSLADIPFSVSSCLGVGDVITRAKYLNKYVPHVLEGHLQKRSDIRATLPPYVWTD